MSEKQPEFNLNRFDLFNSLLSIINDEHSESETNKSIALYLLTNFTKLDQLTMYDVMDDCFVSRSSINRFLKYIGFDKFSQLSLYAKSSQVHYEAFYNYADTTNFTEYVKSMMNNMMDDIASIAENETTLEVAQMVYEYDQVHFLSAESSATPSKVFQEELISVQKFIYVHTSSNTSIEYLERLEPSDVLFVCSLSGNYAQAILHDLERIKAYKVLITYNRSKAYASTFDKIVYMTKYYQIDGDLGFGVRNTYTKYGLLFYLDIIFHHYIKLMKKNQAEPD